MNSYTLEHLYDELLETSSTYIQSHMEKPIKINYGSFRFSSDPRDETPLEKLIREKRSELSLGVSGDVDEVVETIVDTNIVNDKDKTQYYHSGYLEYLLCAWENHMGIQIGPWHLWNLFVWNLKELNRLNPDKYRSLWTTSNDKVNVDIWDTKFDIRKVYQKLSQYIPKETLDTFSLKFDNAPDYYMEAIYGLIGEISQDYYEVSILACNIPKVEIVGTVEEWGMLVEQVGKMKELYQPVMTVECQRYLDKVEEFFSLCLMNRDNEEFWKDFFYVERCGSGSQQSISGKVTNLFFYREVLLSSLPKIVSKFPYKYKDDNDEKDGYFVSGVMSSYVNDNKILTPEFNYWTSLIELDPLMGEELMEGDELVKALTLLNSYSRPPVFHYPITERLFISVYEKADLLLGRVNVEDHLERMKRGNSYLDVDKTRENILKLQEECRGKDIVDLLDKEVDEKLLQREARTNFWYEGEVYHFNKNVLCLSTEQWLKGRRRQSEEDIDLICRRMLDILQTLMECYPRRNNELPDEVINVVYSSYNERVYCAFIDTLTFEFGCDPVNLLTSTMQFLLMNSVMNDDKDGEIDNMYRRPLHSESMGNILIEKIMENYPEVREPVHQCLIEDLEKILDNLDISDRPASHFRLFGASTGPNYYKLRKLLELGKNNKNNLLFKTLIGINRYVFCSKMGGYTKEGLLGLLNESLDKRGYLLRCSGFHGNVKLAPRSGVLNPEKFIKIPDHISSFMDKLNTFCGKTHQNHNPDNFWKVPEYNDCIGWSGINIEQWRGGLEQQKGLLEDFDNIYHFLYLHDTNGCLWINNIFWTLNPTLYQLFLDNYRKSSYPLRTRYDNPESYCFLPEGELSREWIEKFDDCLIHLLYQLYKEKLNGHSIINEQIVNEILEKIINNNCGVLVRVYNKLLEKIPNAVRYFMDPGGHDGRSNAMYNMKYYPECVTKLDRCGGFYRFVCLIRFIGDKIGETGFDHKYLSKVVSKTLGKEIVYTSFDLTNDRDDIYRRSESNPNPLRMDSE